MAPFLLMDKQALGECSPQAASCIHQSFSTFVLHDVLHAQNRNQENCSDNTVSVGLCVQTSLILSGLASTRLA
jgi:hypothetical protein